MMKKPIIWLSVAAMLAVPLRSSYAGDKEWATAGKIMAGLAALAILSEVVSDLGPVQHVVYAPAPHPRRVIYVQAPRRVWVEGRHIEVVREEWVPGYTERVWVPPAHERVWVATPRGGFWKEVLVQRGHYREVWHPGQKVLRRELEWVPAHWEEI